MLPLIVSISSRGRQTDRQTDWEDSHQMINRDSVVISWKGFHTWPMTNRALNPLRHLYRLITTCTVPNISLAVKQFCFLLSSWANGEYFHLHSVSSFFQLEASSIAFSNPVYLLTDQCSNYVDKLQLAFSFSPSLGQFSNPPKAIKQTQTWTPMHTHTHANRAASNLVNIGLNLFTSS